MTIRPVGQGTVVTWAMACVTAAAAVLLVPGHRLIAQVPQFLARTDLVTLDVSVVDDRGAPVTGLTIDDFILLEDGRPQTIEVFHPIEVAVRDWPAPWLPLVRQDVATNDAPAGRLVALVIDDAMMPASPYVMNAARLAARSFIAHLGPDDRCAVVFTRDSRGAQPFTADRARLEAAVDRLSLGFAAGGGVTDSHFAVGMLRTLDDLVTALGEVQHFPRALVYLGPGLDIDWFTASAPGRVGDLNAVARQQVQQTYASRLKSLLQQAARSHIAIHTITPGGLAPKDFELTLSGNTGGVSIVAAPSTTGGDAYVVREVSRVAEATRVVYLLGYRPAALLAGIRRTEVRVRRPGLRVHTRAYLERDDADRGNERRADSSPEIRAIAGALPQPGMPLRALAVPLPTGSPRHATVAIVMGIRHVEGPRAALETVTLVANAYDMEGRFRGGHRGRAQVEVSTRATGPVEYEVYARLDLRPGRYQLRLSADHRARNATGSVYTDVDVPDFTAAGVHMSDVLLDAGPARLKAAPPRTFGGDLPIQPTAQRRFAVGSRLVAFTRLIQGGRSAVQPVIVRLRVTDERGAVVRSQDRTLTPGDFRRGRATDYLAGIETSDLTPGWYLIEVIAETGDGRTQRSTATIELVVNDATLPGPAQLPVE